jgi:paired amphipathic helix protein Sin3a
MSNVRGDSYAGLPQAQTPRPAAKMPPIGQFDPPSTSKDNKKRRTGPGIMQGGQSNLDATLSSRNAPVQVGNLNKRQKLANQRQVQPEAIVTSPTLVPQLPEPLPPYPHPHTTQEELAFFDRAKKQIGNRASYAEFLKLINLYTQDLIDKYTLNDRVTSFIGGNPDLMGYFRDFLGITESEEVIEARIRPDPGRVNLAHCRSLGPSYRHLPKRDQNKTCKGRDGMCYQVLNDVWASHPTWASEDSGFVAHRKNQYEEALHRIEEERHDYDFHIESCQRTIQLMEPLVQQIQVMSDQDRAAFQLAPGLGGVSEAIPKRIIMKIYGREVGNRVMAEMFQRPVAVLPIVLGRLKQKIEEWKATQREWEKVWRDQINKQFWKSLDHQGINAKNTDKKNFQHKTLTTEIQAKYEEGKKSRENGAQNVKKHQLEYEFHDMDVILDAARLVMACIDSDRAGYNVGEVDKIKQWFLDFVPQFFGINAAEFAAQAKSDGLVSRDEEMQDGSEIDGPVSKPKAGKSLLRKTIDKRNGKDDSASASKESTPIPTTEHDMDVDEEAPIIDLDESARDRKPWINHVEGDYNADKVALEETYPHTTFNLYANANIYCFFRLFQTLYARILAVKNNEQNVVDAIARFNGADGRKKAAIDLKMVDKTPDYYFPAPPTDAPDHYYREILHMCEDVITGGGDQPHLEETLRRYYNRTGWQLYTVDKLVMAILRFIMNILGGDLKDKSVEITNLFFRDRERPDTTRRQEIQYRKAVERYSKDGEVYRISYVRFLSPEMDSPSSSDTLSLPDSPSMLTSPGSGD